MRFNASPRAHRGEDCLTVDFDSYRRIPGWLLTVPASTV